METREERIAGFTKEVRARRHDFLRQMKEVRETYPLVALLVDAQTAALQYLRQNELVAVSTALTDDLDLNLEAVVESERRYRELIECLRRSTDYTSGLACFERDNREKVDK